MFSDIGLYDYDGNPVSAEHFYVLMHSREEGTTRYKVAVDYVGKLKLSTVWIGMASNIEGPPLIFETMAFAVDDDGNEAPIEVLARYPNEDRARAGHEAFVAVARDAEGVAE